MDPYSENTPKAVLKKKNQNCSVENEDEPILEDMIGEVDFSFDLQGVHSDLTNIFEKFVQKELIKSALRKQYAKAKKIKDTANVVTKTFEKMTGLDKQREKIKQGIKARKTQLEKTLTAPPFLRTSDKFAFTLGIVGLCLTEFILLRKPEVMPTFYAFLIIPLLTARYYFYHKQKYHYFMLDFCYYVQVLLLVHLFLFKTGADFFQVLFSMSNGPLCVAIVMWRNSLVFHDLDKITSVFIHIFPPLVTFCMRWFPINGDTSSVCLEPDCHMSVYYAITLPFLYYCVWQALYLFKTEILDGEKIRKDNEIMTSVKWLTQVKPHPIYLLMKKYGLNPNPVGALVVVQGIYTLFTLLPNLLIFEYFEIHVLYLIFIFVVCVWNGANFYFEVFSDTYALRLKKHLKEAKIEKESETIKTDLIGDKIIAPSVAQEQVLAQ